MGEANEQTDHWSEGQLPPRCNQDDRPVLSFETLARGKNTVLIDLDGIQYVLKRTRSGKLVLNK